MPGTFAISAAVCLVCLVCLYVVNGRSTHASFRSPACGVPDQHAALVTG